MLNLPPENNIPCEQVLKKMFDYPPVPDECCRHPIIMGFAHIESLSFCHQSSIVL